jgi:large subunit ribosomal protein L10
MPTAEKVAKVEELSSLMSGATAIYLADFTGIDVESVTALRSKLRQASVEYQVVKNRLARRAAHEAGIVGLDGYLTGPTAMAFTQGDPVAAAKILQDFADAGGKLAIKTGVVEQQVISGEQVKVLAKLPSREQLLAGVARGVQAPLYGLAAVLTGLLRGLVGTVAALEQQRREGAEEPAA